VLRGRRQALNIAASEEQNAEQLAKMRIENCCGEILCIFKPDADKVGLSLCGSLPHQTAMETWLTLRYDPAAHDPISLDGTVIPVQLSDPHTLEVHIHIDGSVAEVFVNKQISYTKRFYYSGVDAPMASLRIQGKTTKVSSLEMWQLTPISPNRLTT